VDCRPSIEIDYPPRAATLQSEEDLVDVTGVVRSPLGEIESFTINGTAVDIGEDGSFSYPMAAYTGGNVIVAETRDATGATRRRVQSFLMSNAYLNPDVFPAGVTAEGLGIYLDQVSLDDDDPGQPIDDLASLLNIALSGFDIASFFDPNAPLTSSAGYDIYLTGLSYGSTSIDLVAIDGGFGLDAALVDIDGTLNFDCTGVGCLALGGDGTGGLTIDDLTVSGTLTIDVNDDHGLDVELIAMSADIGELALYSNNGWTNFLLGIVEPLIIGGVVSDLESGLESQISTLLGPLLGDTVSGLSLNTSIDLPNLADPEQTITIDLATDFNAADIHDGQSPPMPSPTQGGAFILRGGAYAQNALEPYENLGVPLRNRCGQGEGSLALPREAPVEIGLSDDLLNGILYAAWNGGLLQFPFGGIEDSALVSNVVVDVSGMLAPTASDCNPQGQLLTQIGDIRIDASLTLAGSPITFTAFTTLTVELEISAGPEGIGIGFSGVQSVQTELNVNEDDAIVAEETLVQVLESALVDTLIDQLGGSALGGIGLPDIDLSGQLGLPPGTAAVAIEVVGTERVDGTTVIRGQLAPPSDM